MTGELFNPEAFEQMAGQMSMEQLPRDPFLAGLSDEMLRVMLARYGGPALEAARDEAAYRGLEVRS